MTTMTPPTRRPTTLAARELTRDYDWRDDSACREVDPELFFPIGYSKAAKDQEEQAKKICRTCPVVETCLQRALETRQDSGVWGGLSEDDRRRIHRRRRPMYRGGAKSAVDYILESRLVEFLELVEGGLLSNEIAQTMGTNVRTVNAVTDKLVAAGRLKAVKTA